MRQEYEPRTVAETVKELNEKKKESERLLATRRKHFLPTVEAEGKYVYLGLHGREYTLHPDSARELGQKLIDEADNTVGATERTSYDEACHKVAGILAGVE